MKNVTVMVALMLLWSGSAIMGEESGQTQMIKAQCRDLREANYTVGPDEALVDGKVCKVLKVPSLRAESSVAPAAALPPDVPDEVGVYFKRGNVWEEVMPEVLNWQTGGVIKGIVTYHIVKPDVNARLVGNTSGNFVRKPPQFIFRLPEGVEITEYQLIRLHTHAHSREFRTVTGGVFHQSGGAMRDTLFFEYEKIAPRTYSVNLSNLRPGEYGFLPPGAVLSSNPSAQLGKMYSFCVVDMP